MSQRNHIGNWNLLWAKWKGEILSSVGCRGMYRKERLSQWTKSLKNLDK